MNIQKHLFRKKMVSRICCFFAESGKINLKTFGILHENFVVLTGHNKDVYIFSSVRGLWSLVFLVSISFDIKSRNC